MRTRAPVAGGKASFSPLPLDLHVLGLPLAFILSQDQTLHRCFVNIRPNETKSIPAPTLDSIYQYMHKAYYMVCFLNSCSSHPGPHLNSILIISTIFQWTSIHSALRSCDLPGFVSLRCFPKRLQIYNCFLTWQLISKKIFFFFPQTNQHINEPFPTPDSELVFLTSGVQIYNLFSNEQDFFIK